MKKIILVIAFFLLAGTAFGDEYNAYLGTSDSGNTTVASGASVLYLEGNGLNRTQQVTTIKTVKQGPWWTIQVEDLDSSIAQQALGGTISKAYDIYAEHTITESWTNADRYYFIKNATATTTTNNTTGPYTIRMPPNGKYRFSFVTGSGTTVFDHVKLKVIGGQSGEFEEAPPVPLSHTTDDFAATGLTNFTTVSSVPDGCKCIEIQFTSTDGGYSSPSTSGVSKIAEENSIIQMPKDEYNQGSFGPGAGVAGEINIQHWTRCP